MSATWDEAYQWANKNLELSSWQSIEDAVAAYQAGYAAVAAAQDVNKDVGSLKAVYDKLDDDSLDAIVEVIGSPKLYNDGKSAMRQWFLGRLRRMWGLPEPKGEPVRVGASLMYPDP